MAVPSTSGVVVPRNALDGASGPTDARRLDASRSRVCLECGTSYQQGVQASDFCSAACRKTWNNRRMQRGAELYDLVMALRFDRQTATELKVWRLINRLAAIFRDEDRTERAGRFSWRSPAAIIDRRPYLRADVLVGSSRSRDAG